MGKTRKNEIFDKKAAVDEMSSAPPGGLTFNVPSISVPVPSQGAVYPQGSALCDSVAIDINAMTAAQENILTNAALAKKGTLMSHLLNSSLVNKAIDVREMLVGDRNTLMIALRISGYGASYPAKVECPNCTHKEERTFELNKLELKKLNIDSVEPNTNVFETRLPMSKYLVRFRFLTGHDEEEMTLVSTKRKKSLGDASSELITSGLLASIVSINGVTDRAELARAIPTMPAADSQYLLKYIQNNEPGIDMEHGMTCSKCDNEWEVTMPLGANFFWPNAE